MLARGLWRRRLDALASACAAGVQSSSCAAAKRSGSRATASLMRESPVQAAVSRVRAAKVATKVFVAATLSSGLRSWTAPDFASRRQRAFGGVHDAGCDAPEARALTAISIRSALSPDCEIARKSWSLS